MIKELHEKIQRGEITSLELTKGYIKTIDEKNDNINALLEVYKEDALREAKKVDEEVKSGNKIGKILCFGNRRISNSNFKTSAQRNHPFGQC